MTGWEIGIALTLLALAFALVGLELDERRRQRDAAERYNEKNLRPTGNVDKLDRDEP